MRSKKCGGSVFSLLMGAAAVVAILGFLLATWGPTIQRQYFSPQQYSNESEKLRVGVTSMDGDGAMLTDSYEEIVIRYPRNGTARFHAGGPNGPFDTQVVHTTQPHDNIGDLNYILLFELVPSDSELLIDDEHHAFIIYRQTKDGVEAFLGQAGCLNLIYYRGANSLVPFDKAQDTWIGAILDVFGRSKVELLHTPSPPVLDSHSNQLALPVRDLATLLGSDAFHDVHEEIFEGKRAVVVDVSYKIDIHELGVQPHWVTFPPDVLGLLRPRLSGKH